MAKPASKKKLKYKKLKDKYKSIIQSLLESRKKLLDKINEMEMYYLDKLQFYKNKNDCLYKELVNDNEEINLKYLDLLKKDRKL